MVVLHVAALERIDEVRDRRVLRRDGNLHTALSHHAVGVAETELRRQDDLGARRMCMERRRTTGTTSAHHQNVGCVVGREIEVVSDGAVTLQQRGQLNDRPIAVIGAKTDRPIGSLAIIWVIFVDQLVTIGWRELRKRLLASSIPGVVHDLLKGMDIHECSLCYPRSVFNVCLISRS